MEGILFSLGPPTESILLVRLKLVGNTLVSLAVERMIKRGCHEVFLETEVTNHAALRLYEKLGFAREERLLKYYLNGHDAFRLKLWLTRQEGEAAQLTEGQTLGSSGDEPRSGGGVAEPQKGDRGEQVNGSAEAVGAAAIMKQVPS